MNRPKVQVANNNQDGALNFVERTGEVNYQPSSATGDNAYADEPQFRYSQYKIDALTEQAAIKKEENFRQPGVLYRSLSKEQQEHLIKNLAGDLGQVRSEAIKEIMVSDFYKADKNYGARLAKAVGVDITAVEKMAATN